MLPACTCKCSSSSCNFYFLNLFFKIFHPKARDTKQEKFHQTIRCLFCDLICTSLPRSSPLLYSPPSFPRSSLSCGTRLKECRRVPNDWFGTRASTKAERMKSRRGEGSRNYIDSINETEPSFVIWSRWRGIYWNLWKFWAIFANNFDKFLIRNVRCKGLLKAWAVLRLFPSLFFYNQ